MFSDESECQNYLQRLFKAQDTLPLGRADRDGHALTTDPQLRTLNGKSN
jgi:hypothetical protein